MAKFEIKKCPVCGSSRFVSFIRCTDYTVSGEEYDIKSCNDCGLKITSNSEDEESIAKYYDSDDYMPHSGRSSGLTEIIYHKARLFMLGRKRRIVESAVSNRKGRLLDVGTGTGYFPYEMKKHGWDVTGTEKSDDARNFALTELGTDIKKTEELFKLENNQFDVITLWHALEHIHRLNENMERFNKLLKKDGLLIIAVPNNDSFDARHYKEFWAAWDVPRHIWHFTPEQMQLLGEKHGFRPERIYPMPLDGFYISMLSEKYKKSKTQFINGCYYGLASWIMSITNSRKSSSVTYIFRKL